MFKEEILENERRREIYKFIEENPGSYLREIQRGLEIPLASLEYHLSYMGRRKVVFSERDGRYKRYYIKPLDDEDKKTLAALRQRRLREIVLVTLSNKKVRYQTFLEIFKIPHSTLSLYLKHLVDLKVLERHKIGYESIYTVRDEDRVVRVLTSYKASFVDRLVDMALSTWMETRFRNKGKPDAD